MDVVILAGGSCPPDLAQATGVHHRCDLPFRGRSIVESVVDQLSPLAEPIVVGGPPDLTSRHAPAGDTFLASVDRGLELVHESTCLIATADLPLLTTDEVRNFLAGCDSNAIINYPIVRQEVAERAIPGSRRTGLALKEGRFTGGNAMLIDMNGFTKIRPILGAAYAARKSPLGLAKIVGWSTLAQVLLTKVAPGWVSVRTLEAAVSRFLHAPVRAVPGEWAGLGADVDNLQQYRLLTTLQ